MVVGLAGGGGYNCSIEYAAARAIKDNRAALPRAVDRIAQLNSRLRARLKIVVLQLPRAVDIIDYRSKITVVGVAGGG